MNRVFKEIKDMKKAIKIGFLAFVAVLIVSVPFGASAYINPSLSLSSEGGNYVRVIVNGDPNASVTLYYRTNDNSYQSSTNIGYTDNGGYLNTTVNSNSYNISPGSYAYISINGNQSSSQMWPYYNGGNYSNIYLSQSNVSLNSGESRDITIYGGNTNSYYVSSGGNSDIVSSYISSNRLSLSARNSGSTTLTICSTGSNNYGSSCATLYVNVSNFDYYNSPVTVSPSSVSVGAGQTVSVNVYGGSGVYHVSSNSDSYVAYGKIIGNRLDIYGINSGTTNINICSTRSSYYSSSYNNNYVYNSCKDVYVSVSSYGSSINYYNNYPSYGQNTAGVFLSQIPYTGNSLSFKVVFFYIQLFLWSAFVTFMILRKKNRVAFAGMSASERIALFKKENLKNKSL